MAAGWSNLVDLEARLVRIRDLRLDARFRAAGRQLQAHPQYPRPAGEVRGRRRGDRPSLLEAGPEKDLYDEYRRIAGQPIESRDFAAAAQSRSVFRQGAGECAGGRVRRTA
jgi:hypothetical protein